MSDVNGVLEVSILFWGAKGLKVGFSARVYVAVGSYISFALHLFGSVFLIQSKGPLFLTLEHMLFRRFEKDLSTSSAPDSV